MSKLSIFSVLFALLGEIIIGMIFFWFIPEQMLFTNLRVLDFIVVSVVYLLWLNILLRPMIKLTDESQKQVGGLGIRLFTKGLYTVVAIGTVIHSIVCGSSGELTPEMFKTYLLVQLVLFFLFIFGMLGAFASEKKTEEVYYKEKTIKTGKKEVRQYVTDLLYAAEDATGVPDGLRQRIRSMASETRFITPSSSQEALHADDKILECCNQLMPAFKDYEMNKSFIEKYLDQLERDIERRRKSI